MSEQLNGITNEKYSVCIVPNRLQWVKNNLTFAPMPKTLKHIEILLTALVYIIAARIGQFLAIDPGNVTPVWIPSGLMVALVLYKGAYLWPGVFIGAFVGNVWAYLSFESANAVLSAISAATLNGIGDVICCVVMAQLIRIHTQTHYPFTCIRDFSIYAALAIFAGPLISAVFGIGGLTLFGFIEYSKVYTSFFTWFIGDATGAMIFGPLLLSWLTAEPNKTHNEELKIAALAIYSAVFTAFVFDLAPKPDYIYLLGVLSAPIALFTVMNMGQRAIFTIQSVMLCVAVYATSFNKGPFSHATSNEALLELQVFIAAISLVMFTIAIIVHQQQKMAESLEAKQTELERLYRQDQLTKTWNRYRITEFIDLELSRFNRSQQSFGLLMIDLDNFKTINDQYGHSEGDKVLVATSTLINGFIRNTDLFGRWGGEEFVLVSVNTDEVSLMMLAEKIREMVDTHDFGLRENITVSIGAAMVHPKDTILSLVDRADEALYVSKRQGKNKVNFKN